jgi:hypothetical protein
MDEGVGERRELRNEADLVTVLFTDCNYINHGKGVEWKNHLAHIREKNDENEVIWGNPEGNRESGRPI